MDIIIDTEGQADLLTKDHLVDSDEDDLDFENDGTQSVKFFDIEEDLIQDEVPIQKVIRNPTKDIDLEEFEKDMGWSNKTVSSKRRAHTATPAPDVTKLTKELTSIDQVLKKSVIAPGFEQLNAVPPYMLTERLLQAQRRKERAKTKGKSWFNMPAPELTPEVKNDLQVIRMRSVLDPKHFYKKNDLKTIPKYFQIGKVMDSHLDYYSGRLTKKERKKTIVDELMADAEFSKFNKRKYKEIIDEKRKLHYKAHRHARKLKGRKKK
ncbi:deoxynucleotidyltransferase terminal-interacting protein 2 isoform X2 [Bombus terrestris]|uniref:Deoxynucleotidyltransferase terminal-interacting protein 2 isoform X2 n=1 Tax=Bombus terrestris TaxID=30195 RepID=A0A9C6T0Z4_BOMTE|nr:deoxynucleotidyltransferase terminal-interacting protein 2 isoform X2 [Bombus terrestris]XP_048270612.1 deoxynucleotidyltransferase terminal-interacting protein 2 isoform X2 [Bombus terrestris]